MLQLDAPLTFREFMTQEELPLATLFREILLFLAKREDAILFGAQAVNAYCEIERMTHDIDVLSANAADLAEALRSHLADRFRIAVRIREVAEERGFRIYQVRKPKNRHLVDVRQEQLLPAFSTIAGIRVTAPPDLIALKIFALAARPNRPKGYTDRADLRRLLLAFPDLKIADGEVVRSLRARGAAGPVLQLWFDLVREPLEPDEADS